MGLASYARDSSPFRFPALLWCHRGGPHQSPNRSGAWLEEIGGWGVYQTERPVFTFFLSLLPGSCEVNASLPSSPSPHCFFLAVDLRAGEPAGQGLQPLEPEAEGNLPS